MNTECMYVLKEQSLEAAKEFCKYLNEFATKRCEDVTPTYISVALKDFFVTSTYDGWDGTLFKVKAGTYFVWAYGKDYCMYRIRPKGARRGFPYAVNDSLEGLFKDIAGWSAIKKEV